MCKILCKLGFHKFKLDHHIFWSSNCGYPHALFSETCKHCGQKSILRCAHFGWAGVERKREFVNDYKQYENLNYNIGVRK